MMSTHNANVNVRNVPSTPSLKKKPSQDFNIDTKAMIGNNDDDDDDHSTHLELRDSEEQEQVEHDISASISTIPSIKSSSSKNWSMLRNVVHNTRQRNLRSSLTNAEERFLSMIQRVRTQTMVDTLKSKSDDVVAALSADLSSVDDTTTTCAAIGETIEETIGTNHTTSTSKDGSDFHTVVQAAIARARLREHLQQILSKLTAKEAQFLKDLVDSDDVTADQLEHAYHVLESDPLYKDSTCTASYGLYQEEEEEVSHDGFDKRDLTEDCRIVPTEVKKYERSRSIRQLYNDDGDDDDSVFSIQQYNIVITGKEIEVFPISTIIQQDDDRHDKSSNPRANDDGNLVHAPTTRPSKYSYKTWDNNMTSYTTMSQDYTVLGLDQSIDSWNRILTIPMMDTLRKSLPYAIMHDNFWCKYTMSRDGAGLQNIYSTIRQSSRTLLVIETIYGDVFGAFVSSPWREMNSFYGSCEAFLWKMKKSRFSPSSSIEEQMELEQDIEIYSWSRMNRNIQLSGMNKLVIGGGLNDENDYNQQQKPTHHSYREERACQEDDEWGMGIVLESHLEKGTTNKCLTFKSPPLTSQATKADDTFIVSNIEVWTFTPCFRVEEAEQLEMGRMFVLSHFSH